MSKLKLKRADSAELRSKENETDESRQNCDAEKQSQLFSNVNLENRTLQSHTFNNAEDKKTSKYFKSDIQTTSCNNMNESDDFVARKVTKKPPPCKNTQSKSKSLKRKKCSVKNQRDIRTMTKNSNDLIKYTEDFETVCNKGGVDVNPEHLQLAIALSQSLQDYEQSVNSAYEINTEKENIGTSNSNSQDSDDDKIIKIRKTLEQFGFKVKSSVSLENKTTVKRVARRLNRCNYPLIKKSAEQKHQLITDKISEILFQTTICTKEAHDNTIKERTKYFSKCGLNYRDMMDESLVFYVPSLIVPSESKVGCMLKDWSAIPGREKSPEREINRLDFKESFLFANNFDMLLSGTVKQINNITEKASESFLPSSKVKNVMTLEDFAENNDGKISPVVFNDSTPCGINDKKINLELNESEDIFNINKRLSPLHFRESKNEMPSCSTIDLVENSIKPNDNRCISPDIFNDESFCINKEVIVESEEISDDELPNVYISQPRVLKHFEMLKETLYDLDKAHVNDCSDVILIEDEISITNNKSDYFIDKKINNSIIVPDFCLENKNTDANKTNFSFIAVDDDDDDDELYVNDNGIVHYESFDTSVNKSSIESPKSSEIQSPVISFVDIPNQSCVPDMSVDNAGIDLTQSSNEEIADNLENVSNITKEVEISQQNESIISKHSLEASVECDEVFVLSDDELNYSVNAPCRRWKSAGKFSEFINDSISDVEEPELSLLTCQPDVESVNLQTNCETSYVRDGSKAQSCYRSISFDTGKNQQAEAQRHFSKLYRSSILDPITSSDLIDIDNYCSRRDSNINDSRRDESCSITRNSLPDIHLPGIKLPTNSEQVNKPEPKRIASPKGTPNCNKFIMKTKNITPMADYKSMDSPSIIKELTKFGLKPLKRKRAVQILEHIYEQTHPLVDAGDLENKMKRRKLNEDLAVSMELNDSQDEREANDEISEESDANLKEDCDLLSQAETVDIYERNCNKITVQPMNCNDEELIFQSKEKSKIQGCRVPLHIVFHNYLHSRTMLRDTILKYEPVDIERIHRDLKVIGFKFKPKDLMNFFDRKCITIKTATKNPPSKRNKKRS